MSVEDRSQGELALQMPLVAPGESDVAERKAVGWRKGPRNLLGRVCGGFWERVVSEGRRWDLRGKQVTLEVERIVGFQLQEEGWGSF